MVELADKLDERISRLSGGQQRRVDLALGVIGTPDVLFLDEPTTGFDPAACRRSWELVRDLAGNGTTIVLTTHYLEEAEELADHLIVMAGGTVVAAGTPESLRDQVGEATIIRFALPTIDASLAGLLDPLHGDASGRDRRLEISTTKPTADLAHITGWALQHGIELDGLSVESVTLEDVYLRLVGTDSLTVKALSPAGRGGHRRGGGRIPRPSRARCSPTGGCASPAHGVAVPQPAA